MSFVHGVASDSGLLTMRTELGLLIAKNRPTMYIKGFFIRRFIISTEIYKSKQANT